MKSTVGQFVPDGITQCAQKEYSARAKGPKDMDETVWGVNDANVFITSGIYDRLWNVRSFAKWL